MFSGSPAVLRWAHSFSLYDHAAFASYNRGSDPSPLTLDWRAARWQNFGVRGGLIFLFRQMDL